MRHKEDVGFNDMYAFYRSVSDKPISRIMYGKLINAYCEKLKYLLYDGRVIELPYNLGTMWMRRKPMKFTFTEDGKLDPIKCRRARDFGATNKLWKEKPELKGKVYLYFENRHTNGDVIKPTWAFNQALRNKSVYRFSFARDFSRGLAKHIFENKDKIDYHV